MIEVHTKFDNEIELHLFPCLKYCSQMKYIVSKSENSDSLRNGVSYRIPVSLKNRLQTYLLLFGFISFTFSGWFHFHKEVNLHFHAENLLTADHTEYVDNDCNVCDLFLVSANYYLTKKDSTIRQDILKAIVSASTTRVGLWFLIHRQSGRAPPRA